MRVAKPRGRYPRGKRWDSPAAKLDRGQYQQIKYWRQLGHTYRAIAERLGVTSVRVGQIVRGEGWG